MVTWNLSKTLSKPNDPEWESLVNSSLHSDVHIDRKNGFLLSRQALLLALSEQGIEISIGSLVLTSFSEIKGLQQFTISLSHTKTAGAALVADRKKFRSVGIDIEQEERLVKDSIKERITHPLDINLRNIELWCLKEAAFKALMNSGSFVSPFEFSSILISANKWAHPPSGLEGVWELSFIKSLVIAKAFLRA
jgi:phosphopantetheinyl transferase (holo-ACP synthase)